MAAYTKNLIRTIVNNMRRYLAILSIVALGVAFFVGIRSTSPDMNHTLDNYFSEQNVFDVRVLTSLGLSDESIARLSEQPQVSDVMPAYYCDEFVKFGDLSYLVRFQSISPERLNEGTLINKPVLVAGRFPENPTECLIESQHFQAYKIELGSQIAVTTGDESDIFDELNYDSYTVVGAVNSPLYITPDFGSSPKGSGTIDTMVFILDDAFASDVFTEAYLRFYALDAHSRLSGDYEVHRDSIVNLLEPIADEIARERHSTILDEANEKIADARQEIADARQELADAEQELLDGEAEIAENEQLLADKEAELYTGWQSYRRGVSELSSKQADFIRQIAEAEEKLASANTELSAAEGEAAESRSMITEGYAALEAQKSALVSGVAQALEAAGVTDIVVSYGIIGELIGSGSPYVTAEVAQAYSQIQAAQTQLDASSAELAAGEAVLLTKREELNAAMYTLAVQKAEGENSISIGWTQLAAAKRKLDDGQSQINDAKVELADAKVELEDGRREFLEKSAEAEEELANAEADIADAEAELADLPEPDSYVLGLDTNIGFVGFSQDSQRIDAVGYVFPLIFFLVAALVTMTNMLRIVEDDRASIGVLKALGYGRVAIMNKYIVYALSVSIPGILIGISVGYKLFPSLIFDKGYRILYLMPEIITPLQLDICVLASVAALASVLLPTISVCYGETTASPAMLMRPRAPRSGKRVFLERIPPLWNSFSFFVKVTSRNILRYKKRFFMTVIGIAGCTALIVTGYGISDSIKYIAVRQFSEIFIYNCTIEIKDSFSDGERLRLSEYLDEAVLDYSYYYRGTMDAVSDGSTQSASIMVPSDIEAFANFVAFRDSVTSELHQLSEGAVVTQKLSKLFGLSVGDSLMLEDPDGNKAEVEIAAIVENYVGHNIFVTAETYEKMFGKLPDDNTIACITDGFTTDERKAFSTELLADFDINGLSFSADILDYYTDMVNSLNFVVIVLIISAAALAFVVLFSLTAINIDERARELATLKVLGFYRHELATYIFRENAVLTVIGAGAGLILGFFLHRYVIVTVELDFIMFSRQILPQSYVFSLLLTFLFSALVNLVMNRSVNKIDMVESLKSVE